ncbi:MAG TPA: protein kinase [Polyangiaceae bacterium]
MEPGQVLAGRFEVELAAGFGAAGSVYRARDRRTGAAVAVKVLRLTEAEPLERFARETRALAELDHPAIVRFVAEGRTEAGLPFIAMEWVEGEPLRQRLARGRLTPSETLTLARRVAGGLAHAHARGVVHRDINPSNLLLPGGRLEQATIVDFGVVRLGEPSVTLSGAMLGTPGFMAPEQVRGQPDVDARADVFALGCVLFQALTGKPAFAGDAVASLARVLFERAPRARLLAPDVTPAVDELVARMLAREPGDRPRDGVAVLEALTEIDAAPAGEPRARAPSPSIAALTADEQRYVSVIVALGAPGPSRALAFDRARAAATPFGARVERLADGTIVAGLSGKGSARDQARQAARCALALRDVLEDGPIALATCRAPQGTSGVMGEAIEQAAGLLRARPPSTDATRRLRPIAIDPTSAGLLDARFDVVGDDAHLGLRRERATVDAEAPRTLLGRPTPFVGRERELTTLEAVFRECVDEGVSHAVLVTGPSGIGKSRLRRELVQRVRERDDGAEVWIGRGDPMSAGSPLGMLAQVVRAAAGVLEGETLRTRQAKLTARLSRHLTGDDLARAAEFLGELAGIRFPEARSVELRAARRSAVLMGDQMRRAWEVFLAAECTAQPVLLVLEDLHWGDVPTVSFLDGAMRNLRGRPLMILAMAQPDVRRLFPQLWAGHAMTELHLAELSRKASEKLVRQVAGAGVPDATVERVIDHAAGNAFYLEELIRSVVEGQDELPPTVLAMVEARLASLEPEARRVLRAASVFGDTFWKAGVAALLDATVGERHVGAQIEELTRRELVAPRERGRFPDEHVFRHAIVREAAYGMLTETDRVLGHELAGAWLEQAGESDAMALAEQFERGGAAGRAIVWYERAAAQALGGNDFAAAIARARKGIDCGAEGERKGTLLALQAEAHRWAGEFDEVERCLREALTLLPPGGAVWYETASELVSARVRLGRVDELDALVAQLANASPGAGAGSARVVAWARAAVSLVFAGLNTLAAGLFDRIDRAEVDPADRSVEGRVHQARATRAIVTGDLSRYLEHTSASAVAFEAAGDARTACVQRSNAGYALAMLGAYEQAEEALREALFTAERMGLTSAAGIARQNLGLTLARRGALQEARAVEERSVEAMTLSGETIMAACSCAYLAEILALARNYGAAERAALDSLATAGDREHEVRALAYATLARVLLATHRVSEAVAASAKALERLAADASFGGEPAVRLARAEVLEAAGDPAAAREAIGVARDRLLERAGSISSPELRRSFLERVPANARILHLADEWLAKAP